MKKVFTLLSILFVTVGAFATTNAIRASTDSTWNSITMTVYVVSSDLPSPSNWRILANKVNDTVIIEGTNLPGPPSGTKTLNVDGLASATIYRIRLTGWKNGQNDTVEMGTVSTTALPSPPTVTFTTVPRIGTSLLIAHVTGANGYQFSMNAIYGPGYLSTSNMISGTGTFIDTMEVYTPDPSYLIPYIVIGYYNSGVPLTSGEVGRGSFMTPGIDTGRIASEITATAYPDSVRTRITVHVGSSNGTLIASAYDSTGTLVRGFILTPVTISGIYSWVFPASPGQLLRIVCEYNDSYGHSDTTIYVRAPLRPVVPPAAAYLSGSFRGNCTYVTMGQITVIGVTPGYPNIMKIARSYSDSIQFEDTVASIVIPRDTVIYDYRAAADLANTRTNYQVVMFSPSGAFTVSNSKGATTPPGSSPSIAIAVKDSSLPVVTLVGDAWCDRATITVTVYNQQGSSVQVRAINAGSAGYNIRTMLDPLSAGTYTIRACIQNTYGSDCDEESITHVVTSIKELKNSDEVDPNTLVKAYNVSAEIIGEGKIGERSIWLAGYRGFIAFRGENFVYKTIIK